MKFCSYVLPFEVEKVSPALAEDVKFLSTQISYFPELDMR